MFFFPFKDDNPTGNKPFISWLIISLCIIIYLVQLSFNSNEVKLFIMSYGVTPGLLINNFGSLWFTVLSSMFIHGNISHLFGNMLYLWIFGDNVEDSFGKVKFIFFYILCGGAAVIAQTLYDVNSLTPMIGASGAIAGILGGYLVLYPRAKVWVFMLIIFFVRLITVPAFVVLGIWMIMQLMNVLDQGQSGVAYSAHIGGFIAGMILAPIFKNKDKKIFAPSGATEYMSKKISKEDYLKHMPSLGKVKKNKNPWE